VLGITFQSNFRFIDADSSFTLRFALTSSLSHFSKQRKLTLTGRFADKPTRGQRFADWSTRKSVRSKSDEKLRLTKCRLNRATQLLDLLVYNTYVVLFRSSSTRPDYHTASGREFPALTCLQWASPLCRSNYSLFPHCRPVHKQSRC